MVCPLLSLLNQGNNSDQFINCQGHNCAWYIKKIGGGIEVYDCAISALALYTIRDLTQK